PPTPTILGIGIVSDIRQCVTVDAKNEGNPVYLIGETKKEMGGSAYLKLLGISSTTVPVVDPKALRKGMDALISAIQNGFIASCHDISEGGIAGCMAEMMIGGDVGARVDLGLIGNMRDDYKLFSESNTRWIVEVKRDRAKEFEKVFKGILFRIGEVGGNTLLIQNDDRTLIDIPVKELRDAWSATLYDYMG
ncbi:MAG: AIR synthase-related protein, partial [Methanocellales archaeon]|nr:AIR synthase-related protein [Methanocellales archaeon]